MKKNNLNVPVNFRVNEALSNDIAMMADKFQISKSELIRDLLNHLLKKFVEINQ